MEAVPDPDTELTMNEFFQPIVIDGFLVVALSVMFSENSLRSVYELNQRLGVSIPAMSTAKQRARTRRTGMIGGFCFLGGSVIATQIRNLGPEGAWSAYPAGLLGLGAVVFLAFKNGTPR